MVEANIYDGIWILALSVLQADSQDIVELVNVVPSVAEEYVGVSGRCELDSFGDRQSIKYEIYGLSLREDNSFFERYGSYNYETESFTWINQR